MTNERYQQVKSATVWERSMNGSFGACWSTTVSVHTLLLVTCGKRVQVQEHCSPARANRLSGKECCEWSTGRRARGWRSVIANGVPSTSKSAIATANRGHQNYAGDEDTPSHDRQQTNQDSRCTTSQLIAFYTLTCSSWCCCYYYTSLCISKILSKHPTIFIGKMLSML